MTKIVNGKKLTPKQAELFDRLIVESPTFQRKFAFLAAGGSYRQHSIPKENNVRLVP